MRRLPSLRFSIYMSVVSDKGKGRPLGELKATFSSTLKVLQCSKTIMSYDQSQCVLLALCVCALGRGLTEKVLGLGQRRGGIPPPFGGGWGSPPPTAPQTVEHPLGSHIGWRRPPCLWGCDRYGHPDTAFGWDSTSEEGDGPRED